MWLEHNVWTRWMKQRRPAPKQRRPAPEQRRQSRPRLEQRRPALKQRRQSCRPQLEQSKRVLHQALSHFCGKQTICLFIQTAAIQPSISCQTQCTGYIGEMCAIQILGPLASCPVTPRAMLYANPSNACAPMGNVLLMARVWLQGPPLQHPLLSALPAGHAFCKPMVLA